EGENRRKDTKEWGYQRRAEGGKCKREADGTDAQQRRIGREAEDVATSFCGAYDQRDCGSDGDADAQWPHDGSLPSSGRGRHRGEARPHHGDRIVGSKRYGLIENSRTQYTVGMAHPVPPAPTSESGSPENCADRVTRGLSLALIRCNLGWPPLRHGAGRHGGGAATRHRGGSAGLECRPRLSSSAGQHTRG